MISFNENDPVFIIAEIGINFDGSLDLAREMIRIAADAGADAVKFQSFTAEGLVNPLFSEDDKWSENPAYKFMQKLELPLAWHAKLDQVARESGVVFFSTPFETGRVDLLEEIDVPLYKVASGDLTYSHLLSKIASTGKPILLSTGISNLDEVKEAIGVINAQGNYKIVLLHCVSSYPTSYEEANVSVLETLRTTFGYPVGYSDHSPGYIVPLGAVSLGAKVIEKHFTLDTNKPGADHAISMDPKAFAQMVRDIRNLEKALGNKEKKPAPSEIPQLKGARRGIYAACDIPVGAKLEDGMLKCVRPNIGIGAELIDEVLGRHTRRSIPQNHPVSWSDF